MPFRRPGRPHIDAMLFHRARSDSLADLPRIETARLSIDGLAPGDAPSLRRLTDDPAITQAVDFLPTPFTLRDAEDLIRRGRQARGDRFLGAWTNRDAEATIPEGTLIGVVGTHLRGPGAIEIGYWIGGAARGAASPPRRSRPSSGSWPAASPNAPSSPNAGPATSPPGGCCANWVLAIPARRATGRAGACCGMG